MEMVAAARLRRAEQRIARAAALRRRDPAHDAPGGRGRRRTMLEPADPAASTRRADASRCCSSPATAAWPARSTRRSSAPGCAPPPSYEAEGRERRLLRLRPPRRLVADASAAASSRGGYTGFTDRPAYAERARDRRGPDGRLRRRRGRPGRDLLQRLHLAADAGGAPRDAAAAAAGDDPRGRGRARTTARTTTRPATRSSSTSPTRRRSSSGSSRTTSRSRSTARCSSRPRPSTARA